MIQEPAPTHSVNDFSDPTLVEALRIHRPGSPHGPGSDEPWWTIPLLCSGLAIIACCLIVPQTDANRRLAYEKLKLQRDLQAISAQVQVNKGFLDRIAGDANLAERLAQRQMKLIREGTRVLEIGEADAATELNPFLLTAVAPPTPLPAYQSRNDLLGRIFLNDRIRLILTGAGLLMAACGLVLGGSPGVAPPRPDPS